MTEGATIGWSARCKHKLLQLLYIPITFQQSHSMLNILSEGDCQMLKEKVQLCHPMFPTTAIPPICSVYHDKKNVIIVKMFTIKYIICQSQ